MIFYSYFGVASQLFRTAGRRWPTSVQRFPLTRQQPFRRLTSLQPFSPRKTSITIQKQSRVDIGIILNGLEFFTMIPKGSRLPYRQVEKLTNIFDYDSQTSISISSRASILHKPAEITVVELLSNRKVKKEETAFRVMMVLDEYLHGHFTIQDLYTNEETIIEFDGWTALSESEEDCILLPAPI
jgi:hypothetical protein